MGLESTGPRADDRVRRDALLFGVGWLALAVAYAWMQRSALSVLPGDEAIYLLDGRFLAEGGRPYQDWFLAHPPLRVLVAGAFMALGFTATAVKAFAMAMFPMAAGLVGLALLPGRGWRWALLASFFCLFATLSLEIGGVFLGPGLALPLVAGALLAATRGRHGLSGVLLALAGLQATYALLPAPVLAWWALRDRRLGRFSLGLGTLVALYGACFVAWGKPFLDQVLLYHVAKVSGGATGFRLGRVAWFAGTEGGLLAFSLAALPGRSGWGRFVAAAAWLCVLVPSLYQALFVHYFSIALPFLAAASAEGLARIASLIAARPVKVRAAALALLAVVLVVTHLPHLLYGLELHDQRTLQARDGAVVVRAVADHRPRSGRLWGDSAIVPLAALESGLGIALDMADTNDQRFSSGRTRPGEVTAALARLPEKPGVLLFEEHGVWLVPELRDWVQANLTEVFTLRLPALGHVCHYFLPPDEAEQIRRRVNTAHD